MLNTLLLAFDQRPRYSSVRYRLSVMVSGSELVRIHCHSLHAFGSRVRIGMTGAREIQVGSKNVRTHTVTETRQ